MENKSKLLKMGFSTILWAVMAVLVLSNQAVLATEVCVDFEHLNLANGDCVEGLGTVDDFLNISDAIIGDSLILIQEGTEPKAFTGGEAGINGCLDLANELGHGFGIDVASDNETENLKFTFDPSIAVTSFSIRMIDYGDDFPWLWNSDSIHTVRLVAYDRVDEPLPPLPPRIPLDIDELTFTSTDLGETMTTLNGVNIDDVSLGTAGDACLADTGEPGQWIFSVSAEGIVCVELQFVNDSFGIPVSNDGDVAFDDICFTYGGGVINVDIDIKPGSDPNPINQGSNGLIPVAILTTDTFNAADVDPGTVTLNGANVAVRGKSEKMMARLEDVDGDGDEDLMLQVDTESWDQLGADGEVILTGKTYAELGAEDVQGTDYVIIVPPE